MAVHFRIKPDRANQIIQEVVDAVNDWRKEATSLKIPSREQDRMARSFRIANF